MQKREKGITLVALVITIIILLILAGISISALTNQGLFGKAQQAKQEAENAQREENEILANYLEQMNAIGGPTLASKVQPGDYVAYTPDPASTTAILSELSTYSGNTDSTKNTSSTLTQETGLKWRVLDVKDGKVRLISEVPTTSIVTLYGAKGYNNAVYLLDKTCKTLYSKAGYSENVQSLKIEDIQDYLTYDYTQYINSYINIELKYGETKTNSSERYYPNLFKKEKTGWVNGIQGTELELSKQISPINETSTQASSSIKAVQTTWEKKMVESDFVNPIYYNLFINNGSNYFKYCMSSRSIDAAATSIWFNISYVSAGRVGGDIVYNSSNYPFENVYALRPVVTLNANVLIKSGAGTRTSAYEI